MFTLSGVPFFYPFIKNSCVIPANPNYRFTVGCWKSELIVTGICGILAITMQPLFMNGFWTTYNRSFGTIKHVHRENTNTDTYTLCDYSYIDNNITHEGTALVIESKTDEIVLFDRGEIFTLNSADNKIKINHTRPRPSNIPKQYEYFQFFGLSLDSIRSIMHQNLVTGLIQSNYNVEYIDRAITYHTNFINLKNKFNFFINAMADSIIGRNTELAELEAVQLEEQRRYARQLEAYNRHTGRIAELEKILSDQTLSNYERNRHQNELISLRNRSVERPAFEPSLRTQVRIDELRRSLSERNLQFSGYLTIYKIVDPSLPEVRELYREIEDNYLAKIEQNKSVYQPINNK
jgi:inner membrane protein